jgi:hypothetical protein
MVLTVVVPMSRKARDMGTRDWAAPEQKENGVRDLGHPPTRLTLQESAG